MATDTADDTQAALEQSNGQVAVLEARVRALAGFEQEVRSLRDTVDAQAAQIETLTGERDTAARDANTARAQVASAQSALEASAGQVAAARQVADGIRTLLA